ncbi:hypothetical protein KPSA1_04967 [Pseudomonas syringae pv. actinidiae]|uniref:Uncharacterized protein n=1 Tax=Pseudomonas syringae pv. actinidiae TaxID=103796 RepID=A0A2V0QEG5_PSESF|nr:hypothetical protein KPSA1_04967 [Pseudomonas syringae pv. actinidiae]
MNLPEKILFEAFKPLRVGDIFLLTVLHDKRSFLLPAIAGLYDEPDS